MQIGKKTKEVSEYYYPSQTHYSSKKMTQLICSLNMKTKILISVIQLFIFIYNINGQSSDSISLHIVVPQKILSDTAIYVKLFNHTDKTIAFENPHRFKSQTFNSLSDWVLEIKNYNDTCYFLDYFKFIKPIGDLNLKLKPNREIKFEIPINPKNLDCLGNNAKSEIYQVQLKLKLLKPKEKEIFSNVEEFIIEE